MIRKADDRDFDRIWPIFHEIVSQDETYAYSPDTDRNAAFKIWMVTPTATYVALDQGKIMGTYYIKPNQAALGAHVCNAGFMVSSPARGRGIGRAMCEHSQTEAVKLGFKAMQFNLVVSTNKGAIKLWTDMGFSMVGTLPHAFKHKNLGFVDAVVMYKLLEDQLSCYKQIYWRET
jgi:L-amino acid N-acyltransferase YncA